MLQSHEQTTVLLIEPFICSFWRLVLSLEGGFSDNKRKMNASWAPVIKLLLIPSCQILSSSYRFIGGHFTDPHGVMQLVSFLASLSLSRALATIHHDWVNPVRWEVPAVQTVRHCASLVSLCTCHFPAFGLWGRRPREHLWNECRHRAQCVNRHSVASASVLVGWYCSWKDSQPAHSHSPRKNWSM